MANTLPLTQLENELRTQVAVSCRIIGHNNVTKGTLGHVSARVPGTDRILIKSRGPAVEGMEYTTEKDIIMINGKGELLEGAPEGLQQPQETAMHLVLYRKRPEVMSVIHSHPDWIVVLTSAQKPLVPMVNGYDGGSSTRMLMEGCPIYPRSLTITNDELAEDFYNTMQDHRFCLLMGHGMTTAGASVEEATQTSLTVYEIARLNYLTYAIGQPTPVSEQDTRDYAARRAEGGAQRRLVRAEGAESAFWKYEKKKLPPLPQA